ncbi:restriction endonuclease subunit S [Bifidobacterium parmae]|uniref:Type I restriction system specificity protein n=1 Tax=Bifidobacterium parmae TaxID=361854 RepID=A0A2N5J5N5_9BIFI|nr:restriction endonuclease subunit S [Bifidobacterium parmae]PLS29522.1 type I restriction system specificity protein [Bifidobacterium parmae]
MSEQRNVPEVRFAGFTDPWEQRKLGDIADSFSGGTPDVSNSAYYGGSIPFIRSAEINSDSTELSLTQQGLGSSATRLVRRGTILYALYGATSGEVGIARLDGAINQAVLAILPNAGNDSIFIASWLRKEKANIVDTYLQGGQGNLSGSIVKSLVLSLPTLVEQQTIGAFFSRLDDLITLHQRKHDKLVVLKKSMLEKMFPKEGESVPEVRFAGFADPWEQRKLGDIADSFSGGTPDVSNSAYYGGSIPFIRSAEINSDSTELSLTQQGLGSSATRLVRRGTILYALYGATSGEVGIARLDGAINQAVLAILPNAGNDSIFIASWLRKEKANIVDTYLQGGQGNLSGSIVKSLVLSLPTLVEQQTIGAFFSRLDDLITLHQRKLELLKNIKQSMLDKMFV